MSANYVLYKSASKNWSQLFKFQILNLHQTSRGLLLRSVPRLPRHTSHYSDEFGQQYRHSYDRFKLRHRLHRNRWWEHRIRHQEKRHKIIKFLASSNLCNQINVAGPTFTRYCGRFLNTVAGIGVHDVVCGKYQKFINSRKKNFCSRLAGRGRSLWGGQIFALKIGYI